MNSVDLNLQWELDQLVRLRQRQPDLLDMALRQVMAANEELRWSMVVGAYLDGQISLGKAAELLNLHSLQLRERFSNSAFHSSLVRPTRLKCVPRLPQRAATLPVRRVTSPPPLDDRHS